MSELNVFISHLHDNIEIANVISSHLKEWGVNEDSIFQSSDPSSGLTPGNNIKEELQDKLTKVNLLLLIYTDSDADWAYCMWECGIAQGKSTVPTRTVVFQCTKDEPTVFKDELRVVVSPSEIRRFVEDFHKKSSFIPSINPVDDTQGFSPDVSDEMILTRSERFFDELDEVIPSGTSSSRHMWDFIRLKLDSGYVTEIEDEDDIEKKLCIIKEQFELREPRYTTLGSSVDTALKQFGFAGYEEGLKLNSIIERWREEDTTNNDAWIEDLYDSIYRALTNSQSVPLGNMMKSVRVGVNWWFLPIVTRMRSYRDNSREFDLYLVLTDIDSTLNTQLKLK